MEVASKSFIPYPIQSADGRPFFASRVYRRIVVLTKARTALASHVTREAFLHQSAVRHAMRSAHAGESVGSRCWYASSVVARDLETQRYGRVVCFPAVPAGSPVEQGVDNGRFESMLYRPVRHRGSCLPEPTQSLLRCPSP